MKVLHVIPSLSAVHGGPSRAIRLIEQSLLAHGVAVEIATTDDDGPGKRKTTAARAPLPQKGIDVVGGPPPGRSRQPDISIHYFPKCTEFYKVSPGFARWIFRHARDYDLIHIHALFSFTSIAAAWAARLAGVPYVVRPLGTLAQYGVTQRRPWLKRLSLKFVEGPILRHAAAVHFTAEAEKREAEALGIPMCGVVIPLAVEAGAEKMTGGSVIARNEVTKQSSFHKASKTLDCHSAAHLAVTDWEDGGETTTKSSRSFLEGGGRSEGGNPLVAKYPQLANKRIVLFLSRLDAKKNVEGLMKAFGLLASNYPDLHLLIAGDGEPAYVAGLKALAKNPGLADRVTWAGHLDGEMKASAFAASSVFALPSYSENFGIAAAEALLAGLPCVLGKGVAIAGEVAQAGAGLAVSPEPHSIAHGLAALLSDELLRVNMAHQAAAFAREKYSVESMGAELVRLYEGIVNV